MTNLVFKISGDKDEVDMCMECNKNKMYEDSWYIYFTYNTDYKFYENDCHDYYFDGNYKFVRVFFRNYINLKNSIKPFLK